MDDNEFELVESTDKADLVRNTGNGAFCWHEYDVEGDPLAGRYSIDYDTQAAAEAAMASNTVEWEK